MKFELSIISIKEHVASVDFLVLKFYHSMKKLENLRRFK